MSKTPKLSGPGKMGSRKAVKQSLKKRGGADIRSIPAEDSITVRFLEGTEDFYGFYEHYSKADNFFPCTEDEDGVGCDSDDPEERRKSFRYLANAYVVDDSAVRLVKIPKSLMDQLFQYEGKKGTLLDRDYELTRTGSGQQDTKYLASPDSPSRMNLDRFKKLDPEKALMSLLGGGSDDDDDDDDDDEDYEPRVHRKKKSKSKGVDRSEAWDDRPRSTKKVGRSVVKSGKSVKVKSGKSVKKSVKKRK